MQYVFIDSHGLCSVYFLFGWFGVSGHIVHPLGPGGAEPWSVFWFVSKEEPIFGFLDLVASLGDWQRDTRKSDPKVVLPELMGASARKLSERREPGRRHGGHVVTLA